MRLASTTSAWIPLTALACLLCGCDTLPTWRRARSRISPPDAVARALGPTLKPESLEPIATEALPDLPPQRGEDTQVAAAPVATPLLDEQLRRVKEMRELATSDEPPRVAVFTGSSTAEKTEPEPPAEVAQVPPAAEPTRDPAVTTAALEVPAEPVAREAPAPVEPIVPKAVETRPKSPTDWAALGKKAGLVGVKLLATTPAGALVRPAGSTVEPTPTQVEADPEAVDRPPAEGRFEVRWIRKVVVCKAVRGRGDYDLVEACEPGQRVVIYVELDDDLPSDRPSEHRLQGATLAITKEAGAEVWAKAIEMPNATSGGKAPRFLNFVVRVPTGLPDGSYGFGVELRDASGRGVGHEVCPVRVQSGL